MGYRLSAYAIGVAGAAEQTYLPGGDWGQRATTSSNHLPELVDSFVFLEATNVDMDAVFVGFTDPVYIPCYFKMP